MRRNSSRTFEGLLSVVLEAFLDPLQVPLWNEVRHQLITALPDLAAHFVVREVATEAPKRYVPRASTGNRCKVIATTRGEPFALP
jgi:hypothetical protein